MDNIEARARHVPVDPAAAAPLARWRLLAYGALCACLGLAVGALVR